MTQHDVAPHVRPGWGNFYSRRVRSLIAIFARTRDARDTTFSLCEMKNPYSTSVWPSIPRRKSGFVRLGRDSMPPYGRSSYVDGVQ
jgi:hypothetical protein